MSKSFRYILFGSLVGVIFSLLIYWGISGKSGSEGSWKNFISDSTILIVDFPDFKSFTDSINSANTMFNQICTTEFGEELGIIVKRCDSVFSSDNTLEIFDFSSILAVCDYNPDNTMSCFFIIEAQNSISFRNDFITEVFGISLKAVSIQEDIYKFGESFYVTDFNGFVIVCNKRNKIKNLKERFEEPEEDSFVWTEKFVNIQKTKVENSSANIFVRSDKIELISNTIFRKQFLIDINSEISLGELDFSFKTDELALNGILSYSDSANSFLSLFENQQSANFRIFDYVPIHLGSIISFNISDFSSYNTKLLNFKGNKDLKESGQNMIAKFNFNFHEWFAENLDGEFGLFSINMQNSESPKYIAYTRIKSSAIFQNTFINVLESGEDSFLKNADGLIFQTSQTDFLAAMFGNIFKTNSSEYFFLHDNFIFFADSKIALNEIIRNIKLGRNLNTNLKFVEYFEEFGGNSNVFVYSNIPNSKNLFSKIFNEELLVQSSEDSEALLKFNTFIAKLSYLGDNKLYTDIFLKYLPVSKNKPKTVWERALESDVAMKPKLLINHNTGGKEVFLQDSLNNIYLISYNGEILWRKQLSEPVISDVFQIDFYRNGKLQILFNTENKVHLIDRNGNYLERYPVNLKSGASTGLSVFDYENDKNYRIFVPLINREIVVLSKEGNRVTGWDFGKSEKVLNREVQHFRVGTKDYIVFADESRIYIYNRRGKERVKPEFQFGASVNNIAILDETNDVAPRLVFTDKSGTIYFAYFSSGVEMKNAPGLFSENHFFQFVDIDNDDKRDFVFADSSTLVVYNQDFEEIVFKEFDFTIDLAPVIYNFSAKDKKIGVVDKKHQQIILINNDGEFYKGFPLQGTTQFSIGMMREQTDFNLFVGGRTNYLFNYKVE